MAKLLDSQLEIDPRLHERKAVLDGVFRASELLAQESETFSPNVHLAWRLPRGDDSRIELTITEQTNTGTGTARKTFPIRTLEDRTSRNYFVWQAWDDILRERIERGLARVGELVTRIEEEELAHAQ